jgi:hypothetical protein
MAAFLLVAAGNPMRSTFSQFGKSFQNSTCGTMGHGRNSNPDDTQLLGVC